MTLRSNTDVLGGIAAERPDAVALWDQGVETRIADLTRNAAKAARALAGLGLAKGDTVLVGWDSLTRHVTLLLALEGLGVTAASFDGPLDRSGYHALFDEASRVLTPREDASTSIPATVTDDTWWTDVLSGQNANMPGQPLAPEDGFRIVRTSGTTGQANLMRASRSAAYARIDALHREYGYTSSSRFMTAMPFSFQAVDHNAFACLRCGGTVIFETRVPFVDALIDTKPTHAALLPMEVQNLDRPTCRPIDGDPLTLLVYGGALSDVMLTRLQGRHPAVTFAATYATNEVGTVARRVTEGVYRVIEDAEVQVTDDQDNPLPAGAEGHIRVRRLGMYDGYIGDPERSALRFRDGWFYPGDIGSMTEDGLLRVIGRADDILNIRGLKLPATRMETEIQRIDGIADAALVDSPNTGGLCLIVSLAPGAALEGIVPKVREILPREAGEIQLLTTASIPRTNSGKVRRNALRASLKQAAG